MIKPSKTLVIGSLALGLFLGSSALINPSVVSAATVAGNQCTTSCRSFTGNQPQNGQSCNGAVTWQFDQGVCKSFDLIVAKAAKLMDVSKHVVFEGINDGETLVEIAVDNDIDDESILKQLSSLQKSLDKCINNACPQGDTQRRAFIKPFLNKAAGEPNANPVNLATPGTPGISNHLHK